ncbi:MAG: hypothetical protein GF329_18440 [Candidatus Lokiarchaeota archaeon]|nr:hypothetical protein [Candidatus Lokiarchaeota archaeon]
MVNNSKKIIFLFIILCLTSIFLIFICGFIPNQKLFDYQDTESSTPSTSLSIEMVVDPPSFMTTGDDFVMIIELVYEEEHVITNGQANVTLFLDDSEFETIDFTNETFYYMADLQLDKKGFYSFIIQASWNGFYTYKTFSNSVVFAFPLPLIYVAYMIIGFLISIISLSYISKLELVQERFSSLNRIVSIIALIFALILFSIFIADYTGFLIGALISGVGMICMIYCKSERDKFQSYIFYSLIIFMASLTVIYIISIFIGLNPLVMNNYMSYIWLIALFSNPISEISKMLHVALKYRKKQKDSELRKNL